MKLLAIAILALMLSASAHALPPPDYAPDDTAPHRVHHPIFVFVMWLSPASKDTAVESVNVVYTDFGGIAPDAQTCANLPMGEILKPVADAKKRILLGQIPKVVCGVAAPDREPKRAHSPEDQPPDVRSEPGHPDQPQEPSGEL